MMDARQPPNFSETVSTESDVQPVRMPTKQNHGTNSVSERSKYMSSVKETNNVGSEHKGRIWLEAKNFRIRK